MVERVNSDCNGLSSGEPIALESESNIALC